MTDHTHVDQRLPLPAVPAVRGIEGEPVDHAAFPPPVAGRIGEERTACRVMREPAKRRELLIFRQSRRNIALLDQHQTDAIFCIGGDLLVGARETLEVPIETAHAALRRVLADAAEPVEVQHGPRKRETRGLEARDLVVELGPVLESVFREPQAKHRLRRHRRMAGHVHVLAPDICKAVARDHAQKEIATLHAEPGGLARKVPFLRISVVEDQRERLVGVIEVRDRKQRVAIGAAVEARHVVRAGAHKTVAFGARIACDLKFLAQPHDVLGGRLDRDRLVARADPGFAQAEQWLRPHHDKAAVFHRSREAGLFRVERQVGEP